MKIYCLIFLLLPFALISQAVPIEIEIASTDQERSWGLMQRPSLPENTGMLFIYDKPAYLSVWMFNCLIDLSAAFIDGDGVIVEIHELKAYPEKMDPNRPVSSINDLHLYPPNDPVYRFFQRIKVSSKTKIQYILEMNGRWFSKKGVYPGDRLEWEPGKSKAMILLQNRPKIGYGFKRTEIGILDRGAI